MKHEKRKKLAKKGWQVGDAKDFLALSDEEARFVEVKLALSTYLRQRRQKKKLTQEQLAQILKSSQSRVAKMEAGDPSVSIDLLLWALFSVGSTKKEIAKALLQPELV